MTKAQLGFEKNERAKALAQADSNNRLEMAIIAYELQRDREMLSEIGFKSIQEWGTQTFHRQWKSVEAMARIYGKLVVDAGLPAEELFTIGTVKAQLLARLPESEIRKVKWLTEAMTASTSDFKRQVMAFLDNSPDHKEEFCRVGFDAPKSFRDEVWKRVIGKGKETEGTQDTHVVVEAALACYEMELQNGDVTEAEAGEDATSDKAEAGELQDCSKSIS